MMNWKRLGKKWYVFVKVKLFQFPEDTGGNHNNPVRICGVSAEIYARHLLNTSLEC
jgi:hypothetical protein